MALSRKGTSTLGVLAAGALVSASVFLIGQPLIQQTDLSDQEISNLQIEYTTKSATLTRLQEGSIDIDGATAVVENLEPLFSTTVDIESASRGVSRAVQQTTGITLESFTFGDPVSVSPLDSGEVSLNGFTEPFDNSGQMRGSDDTPAGESIGDEEELTDEISETPRNSGGLQRVPVVINILTNDYRSLGEFLENLGNQEDRLLFVTSISSSVSTNTTTATVYAYAYFDESLAE